jgi:group I intron endonuclease
VSLPLEYQSGIYKIENTQTNQIYIGSTSIRFCDRWRVHLYQLKNNKHSNTKLQNSWNKYSSNSFIFTVLEIVEKDFLLQKGEVIRHGC